LTEQWYYSNLELGPEKYCESGDLLYSWSASFGPFLWTGPKVIFHYHIWKVICGEELNKYFAVYLLNMMTEVIRQKSHGLAMLHMTKERMQNIPIPLPPFSEQKRIASILKEQMAAVECARHNVEEQIQESKALVDIYLHTIFCSQMATYWPAICLSDLCEINPRRSYGLQRSDCTPTTFIPMSAIDEWHGIVARPEIKKYSEVQRGYTFFAEGDILFAKITPCMQNGKHAIARDLIDGIGFGTTEFHVLRPGKGVISEWIHYFLRQKQVLKNAELSFTGSAGQQRVPEDFLRTLTIPTPSIVEQRRIIKHISKQIDLIWRINEKMLLQLEVINFLPSALLRKAFNGQM
jgi:type I restriction enzyme, S subunit